jgi:hypothetical protein
LRETLYVRHRGLPMHSIHSDFRRNESWRELCEAALLELDSIKLAYRIVEAECAHPSTPHRIARESWRSH